MNHRSIIHLDMDAFYASVEVLDFPELQGLPVIVGGKDDRGVVSAASYEARRYGVHSALSVVVARKRCPSGIFRPVRMERYQEISARIMAIFREFSPLVEQISVDEAFLDVTGCERLLGDAEHIAACIRQRVLTDVGLTVSAGIAGSKLVAKIASDQNKPDGVTVVGCGFETEFLAPLAIQRLWGVGQKTIPLLHLMGVKTIGDLIPFPLAILERKFGKQGRHMYHCARGIDLRDVEPVNSMKSIGNEETFPEDLLDEREIKKELLFLTTKVGERLRRKGVEGSTITLKVKYHDFSSVSRSKTLPRPTSDSKLIQQTILELIPKTLIGIKPVRLAGLSMGKLTGAGNPRQLHLFADPVGSGRQDLLYAIDAINNKYGSLTVKPGPLIHGKKG
ncbi:MAG: DNA polymerase IV [Desulfobulbaceae bacterium]|nr:DNA polymerase IV [Desulfobulbaceae bacterium]